MIEVGLQSRAHYKTLACNDQLTCLYVSYKLVPIIIKKGKNSDLLGGQINGIPLVFQDSEQVEKQN